MSGEPRVGPNVPGTDAPSADVLDELLRAFSVDPDAPEQHREIDFTSPEIVELLTPSGGAPAPPDPSDLIDPVSTSDLTVPVRSGVDAGEAVHADESVESVDPVQSVDSIEQVTLVRRQDAAETTDDDEVSTEPIEPSESTAAANDDSPGVAGDPFLRPVATNPADHADDAADGQPPTISIVDEGMPDTVYIGGNLEPTDVGRSTVVIDDREPAGTRMSLEAATSATKIEPRMRERRIVVKRAEGRKRLQRTLIATGLLLVVVAVLAVLGSGLFGVDEVRIDGAEYTTAEELAAVVDDLEGSPVLRVDTGRIERELEKLPWVDDARVMTQFPGTATIELRERTPAASFQGPDGAWRLIDDTGRVLAVSEEAPVGYLPITGSDFSNVAPGMFAPSGFQGAACLARSLTATVAARAASISVTPNGSDLRLTFTDGTEVRFGPATELVQKLVRLETKLDDLGDEQVTYLDVSTNEIGQG